MSNNVLDMLRTHSGEVDYHPLCSLLDLAENSNSKVADKIAIHKTIVKYCEAELKSIEIKDNNKEAVNMNFHIS